ncbi:TraX family protein [Arcanobacterium hippocoleae]|uniref:ABC transporter permease n=1 Tax=Arcanobacterium hippocoleae TaxID=149017 RepID=A0ABU1T4C5_9ACTO|nr:TraX family protein [Arcanobacterium hippocoleae]MDR6939721.1 hypothetical protein [Arcanobacterium hippocoleae]
MIQQKSPLGKGWTTDSLIRVVYFFLSLSIVSSFLVLPTQESMENVSFARLTIAILAELISWAALPIVAFLTVLTIKHGASLPKMIGLSLSMSVLSEIPYDLVYSHTYFDFSRQNPLWALVVSLIVIYALRHFDNQKHVIRYFLTAVLLVAALLWLLLFNVGTRFSVAPLGVVLGAFIGVFYLMWGMENRMMFSAGFMGAILFLTPAIGVAILHYRAPRFDTDAPIPGWVNIFYYPTILWIAGICTKLIAGFQV